MIDAAPRCQGCRCATGAAPVEAAAPPFAAIVAHGQPGDPGALQPELEALAAGVDGARLIAPLGRDPELPAIGARIAQDAARRAGLDPARATLVVVGHGSKGSRASANSTRAFAEALPDRAGFAAVTTAFIEEAPFLDDVVPDGPAVCLPYFATNGGHTIEDIPQGWRGHGPIAPPIGMNDAIPDLIAAALRTAAAEPVEG